MKFSDYYLSPGARALSITAGVISGVLVCLFTGWKIATLVGAGITVLVSVILPLILYLQDRPYEKIKSTLAQPFLIDERVRFTVEGGSVGGFLILTDSQMILLSLERGDHRLELSRNEVQSIVLGENLTINIYLSNTRFIRVISGGSEELFDILRDNGWKTSGQ